METNLELVIRERLFEINKETEEGLILMMMAEITRSAREKQVTNTINKISIAMSNNTKSIQTNKNKQNQFYVYHSKSIIDWEFTGYNTLEEAVKNAIKYIDAYILHNGQIIKYDVQDDKVAYYYNNNEKFLVQLT